MAVLLGCSIESLQHSGKNRCAKMPGCGETSEERLCVKDCRVTDWLSESLNAQKHW